MPELPEVETTLQGIKPYLEGLPLTQVLIRTPKLRTEIPADTAQKLTSQTLTNLRRRAKFILADASNGHTLLLHLGMSGRLSVLPTATPQSSPGVAAERSEGGTATPPPHPAPLTPLALHPNPPLAKHDHIILTTPKAEVRFNDARRFGLFALLPTATLNSHPYLANLGPEPLTNAFTGQTLHTALQNSGQPIKVKLMDNTVVVGVGNIYASESLFRAGLHPATPANTITRTQAETLARHIKATLTEAIAAGGSTLRDFQQADGQLGYFQHTFSVYGRKGQPCLACTTPIQSAVMGQRNTFWCPTCQSEHRQ